MGSRKSVLCVPGVATRWSVCVCLGIMLMAALAVGQTSPGNDVAGDNHNCRFWGIIAENAPSDVIIDHLVDMPNSILNLSPDNPRGWAVGYYSDGNPDPVVHRGQPSAYLDPLYNDAAAEAAAATPGVAVAHVRRCTSGLCDISDPHAFEREKDGVWWLMGHNGDIEESVLLSLIRPDYFAANPPVNGSNEDEWIDSELYFIFMMQTFEDFNWQIEPALGYVIKTLRDALANHRFNFFLTNGTNLWAYREGTDIHSLYYYYNTEGTPYSAVASQYPDASQGDWVAMDNGTLITMYQDRPPRVEPIENYFGEAFIADNNFDLSVDSDDLRANGTDQDWYESRGDDPSLLTLDMTEVGGNGGAKAAFAASASGNVYLSQEFSSPQASDFSVTWDVYVDRILDDADRDRSVLMLIGQDLDDTNGPNSNSDERFVFLACYAAGGAETGTMDIIAREPGDAYATSTDWRTVASGLNLDEWYTVRVDLDLGSDSYDVYVDDILVDAGVQAYTAMDEVSHISFAQWNDGPGSFFIDNVYGTNVTETSTLTIAVDPPGTGTTDPLEGVHEYEYGSLVVVTATAEEGYAFDYWTGDVADPHAATTTVLMDADRSVTAHFYIPSAEFLADGWFDESASSEDLRADGAGQDWYESRGDAPELLYLSTGMVGANSTPKAGFTGSSAGNTYMSQAFGAHQTGVFAVQWDVYIEEIMDISAPDRTCWMLVGDDTDPTRPGPNSDNDERFVYMVFERDGGGTSGTMALMARDADDEWEAFTTVATGLNIGQWYTVMVVCDLDSDSYDVFVDGAFCATIPARTAKTQLTHISFAQWNDGAGSFYIDNVMEAEVPILYTLTMAADPAGSGTTIPSVGTHVFAEGEVVSLSATGMPGYVFDHWSGPVTDPLSSGTTVEMYVDQTVTAHFVRSGELVFAEPFETGFTLGVDVGEHEDWYDDDANSFGCDVTAGAGVAGSVGLTYGGRIFTWIAHPFNWNDPGLESIVLQMDFMTNDNGGFDDDRIGWMIADNSVADEDMFAVQLEPYGHGYNIEGYWDGPTSGDRRPSIVELPTLSADTWYRFRAEIGRLSELAASIGVSLTELDALGNPVGEVASGSIANTSLLGDNAPNEKYFTSGSIYAAFKNHGYNTSAANVDNAYFEIIAAQTGPHTLAVNVTGNGSVVVAPDQPEYDHGENITLTATGDPGWVFNGWTGDLGGADNPITFAINRDMVVTAVFTEGVAPVITSEPVIEATTGLAYAYDVAATGNPAPEFALIENPDGMTIDAASGLIAWTPSVAGDYNVVVEAANVIAADTQSFVLSVSEPNRAPELAAVADQETYETQQLTFEVSATDPDGDPLFLSMSSEDLPDGLFTDNGDGTGTFDWTPAIGEVGTYTAVFTVSDAELEDVDTAEIVVHEAVIPLLVDNDFETSIDSDDLRADTDGADWYESRGDDPSLLTLNMTDVGGNAGKKAAFVGSTSGNAYLSQELGTAQSGVFAVEWDIYVDEILDISAPDRTGIMLIGDDTYAGNGPNADNSERFVYMAFFRDGGGTSGTMDLVARDRDDGWTAFSTVATGLNLDQWYRVKVVCDLTTDMYDIFVDGFYQASVSSRIAKDVVTHLSFAQWNDGSGSFFVDNVNEATTESHTLTMAVGASGGGTVDPGVGSYGCEDGLTVEVGAVADVDYAFDHWTGEVADPLSPVTTVLVDGDKTVTAHFRSLTAVSSVSGHVTADATGLLGVYVDLVTFDAAVYGSALTDADGYYLFEDIPAGNYTVELRIPLTFDPASEPVVSVNLNGQSEVVDFILENTPPGTLRNLWWWEVYLADLRDDGPRTDMFTREDVETWCAMIFDHFADRNDGFAIQIEDVTYTGDPPRALTFDELLYAMVDDPDNSYESRVHHNLLCNLLNLVSDRMSVMAVVSEDGATASQAIIHFVDLYFTGERNNLRTAYLSLRDMGMGNLLAAGLIPLSTPNVAFKPDSDQDSPDGLLPESYVLEQNYPNPFNPVTEISFGLPHECYVRLDVFNAMGQRVATLVDRHIGAGYHTVPWDAGELASGVYLYRLKADTFVETKKMLLIK